MNCAAIFLQHFQAGNMSFAFGVKEVEEMYSTAALRNKRFKLNSYLNFHLNVNHLSRNKLTLYRQNAMTFKFGQCYKVCLGGHKA
jgi:hypothetical protein